MLFRYIDNMCESLGTLSPAQPKHIRFIIIIWKNPQFLFFSQFRVDAEKLWKTHGSYHTGL